MLTTEDKSRREGRITGSLISGIVGANPWVSPYRAYRIIMGEENPQVTEAMRWGNALEPVIAQRYADENGVKLVSPGTILDPHRPWMAGTPDRLHEDKSVGIEIKTVGARQAWRWNRGVPDSVLIQCAWYQALTKIPVWRVVPLIGGNDYRCEELIRDPDLEKLLIKAGYRFWQEHILPKKPPPVDGRAETEEWIRETFAKQKLPMKASTKKIDDLAEDYRIACKNYSIADRRKKVLRNQLMVAIGDAEGVEGAWGRILWREQKKGGINWKGVAAEFNPSQDLIEKFRRPGARIFRTYFMEEPTDEQ